MKRPWNIIRTIVIISCLYFSIRAWASILAAHRIIHYTARDLKENQQAHEVINELEVASRYIQQNLDPLALIIATLLILCFIPYRRD